MANSKALVQLIEVIDTLAPEERERHMNPALAFFGGAGVGPASQQLSSTLEDGGHFAPEILARMKQHGISPNDAVHVFEFAEGEPFKISAVPGKGKKVQVRAMYQLVGLGTYLETGKREFADATVRQYCKDYGCYDQDHHAEYLDPKLSSLTGDKRNGWLLTVPGIKIAAAMLKEVADAAAKS